MHKRSIVGILENRKRQTRRIINLRATGPNPPNDYYDFYKGDKWVGALGAEWKGAPVTFSMKCPYGQPGDRLWVREAWQQYRANSEKQDEAIRKSIARIQSGESNDIVAEVLGWSRADGERRVLYAADFGDWAYDVDSDLKPWKPSIHMPRWASRLTLEITGIRVERVQDASIADIIAEGVRIPVNEKGHPLIQLTGNAPHLAKWPKTEDKYLRYYWSILWCDTNGKGAWDRNDWCWVVDFKRIDQ